MSPKYITHTAGFQPEPINLIPAVERCVAAWTDTFNSNIAKDQNDYAAAQLAGEAYRLAMPALTSEESIAEFIACTAHGIILDVFEPRQGSQLLYAAQVASAAFDRARKSQKQKALAAKKSQEYS